MSGRISTSLGILLTRSQCKSILISVVIDTFCCSPESLGLISALVFLFVTIHEQLLLTETKDRLVEYNAGLLAICLSILLGFVDDILELRWRDKVIVTMLASYPLLVAYKGLTSVIVPKILTGLVGSPTVDLSYLYYVWMCMFAIWCPNSINIYAGINGLEVGQSFVIGSFILIHNLIVSCKSCLCFTRSLFVGDEATHFG